MFGYIKKNEVLEIMQKYYGIYDQEGNEAFARLQESVISGEGFDEDASRDHLGFKCAAHAIYVILKEIEKL